MDFLLQRGLLLTALELLMEAGEAGLECAATQRLRAFFRSEQFPPEAVVACNPEGTASYAALAAERQQELSQLKYELAVAQEELQALRLAAASEAPHQLQEASHCASPDEQQDAGLPPAQLAALERAILAHLRGHGCRLSAMAFRQEALALGAKQPQPAAPPHQLAQWYTAAQQLGPEAAARQRLEGELAAALQQLDETQAALQESRQQHQAAAAELDFVRGRARALEQQLSAQAPGDLPRAPLDAAATLSEVAACLARVLPSTLVSSRQELVPAILAMSSHEQLEPGVRRQLAGLLVGLIARPNAAQASRRLIGARDATAARHSPLLCHAFSPLAACHDCRGLCAPDRVHRRPSSRAGATAQPGWGGAAPLLRAAAAGG